MMDNMKELNMNEMETVSGGVVAGGMKDKPAAKNGYIIHKITATDTVWALSRHYGCTMDDIVRANPTIQDKSLIRTGYYLYIPKKK